MTATNYLSEMAEGGYVADAIGPFHEHMVPALLIENGVKSSDVVLDIGAGQGHGLIPLRNAGFQNLIALDRDSFNLERFESEFGFQTTCCNVECDPFDLPDASVDAAICFHLIEHLWDPDNLLSELRRVLRPGGTFFLVTPDWRKQVKTFFRDPTHVRPYDKASLGRLLRMHGFEASLFSWGAAFGLGRLGAYRHFFKLGLIGRDQLAIGRRQD